MSDISPQPSLAWRVFAVGGLGTLAVLSTSDRAWSGWEATVGSRVPRSGVRAVLGATLAGHVVEASMVRRRAAAAGLDRPGRWARSTLVYGFPVLGRLRRAEARARSGD